MTEKKHQRPDDVPGVTREHITTARWAVLQEVVAELVIAAGPKTFGNVLEHLHDIHSASAAREQTPLNDLTQAVAFEMMGAISHAEDRSKRRG